MFPARRCRAGVGLGSRAELVASAGQHRQAHRLGPAAPPQLPTEDNRPAATILNTNNTTAVRYQPVGGSTNVYRANCSFPGQGNEIRSFC